VQGKIHFMRSADMRRRRRTIECEDQQRRQRRLQEILQ
jgi:hypothetical protein